MTYVNSMKTVMGGLALLLVLSACSSGSKTRTASSPPARGDEMASTDRRAASDRGTSFDPTDRMSPPNRMTTERPVPSDRLGTGDRHASGTTSDRMASDGMNRDRIVPCADAKGDTSASSDCARMNQDRDGNRTRVDDSAALAAACASRTDAQGNVVYDDPACPDRYRSEHPGSAMAGCSSHRDDKGKLVYDDPNCPKRSQRPMGSSYENIRWTQESAFYDRHADKAVKHARQAELAGDQGHATEMVHHAEMSLDQAKEAQRAGHQPDLDAGIVALRQAITLGHSNQVPGAASSIRDARIKLSRAAGITPADTRIPGQRATTTGTSSAMNTRTVRGELIPDRKAMGTSGGEHYVLRDPQNREMPISLSPEMSRQVAAGDTVEAQIDSNGQVVAISKSQ